jgi:hypothetical protein
VSAPAARRSFSGSAHDHRFYPAMAFALIVLIAAGFAPTFFARGWNAGAPPLALPVLAHGISGTAWVLLFAVQTTLIAAGRSAWHRRLGWATAAITLAFVVTGAVVIGDLERSHGAEPTSWRAAHVFTNGAPLTMFGLLVCGGVWQRDAAPRHKRLMLLAAVVLLPPAIGRLFGRLDLAEFNLVAYASFAFANTLYDWLTYRRPHVVSWLGGVVLVAVDVTTTAWLAAIGS